MAFARTVKRYQAAGAQVNIVMWRPTDWQPSTYATMADDMVALVQWLRAKQGITAALSITVWNEPNIEFTGPVSDYVTMYTTVRKALDNAGLSDVALIGSDSSEGPQGQFEASARALGSVVGSLSFHQYPPYDQPLLRSLIRADAFVADATAVNQPALRLWEANLAGGTGANAFSPGRAASDNKLLPDRFESSLTYACYVVQALAHGVKGVNYWELFDMDYAENHDPTYRMQFGAWGAIADEFTLRPMYYVLTTLSPLIRAGATVCATVSSQPAATITLGVRNSDGRRALFVVNPWASSTQIKVTWPVARSSLSRLEFSPASVGSAVSQQALRLSPTTVTVSGSSVTTTVPATSLCVLYE